MAPYNPQETRVLGRRLRRSLAALRGASAALAGQPRRLRRGPPAALRRLGPWRPWESAPEAQLLVLAATYGNGHIQAGRALVEAAASLAPALSSHLVDFFELVNPVLNATVRFVYLYSVRRAPRLWREFYQRTGRIPPDSFLQQRLYHLGSGTLRRLVGAVGPSVVLSTHPTPGGVAAQLREEGLLPDTATVTVVTDFVLHSQWVHPATDLYLTPCPEVAEELVQRGIRPERIRITGIPIRPRQAPLRQPGAVRLGLGLDPELPLVVLLCGAFGMMRGAVGAAQALAEVASARSAELVVVTGHDLGLRALLEERVRPCAPGRLHVLGYVERLDELMAAADVLVTKAGGLTVSEALAVGAPMVIYAPIPGQEEGNAAYLERHRAGMVARDPDHLAECVGALLDDQQARLTLSERSRRLGRPDAALQAASAVLALMGR